MRIQISVDGDACKELGIIYERVKEYYQKYGFEMESEIELQFRNWKSTGKLVFDINHKIFRSLVFVVFPMIKYIPEFGED